ncbi:MAG: glycosyltransferase family 4 protein, partial [Bdellovibrionales bacterium]|nr:glycosyltransferase family 4 protein [Bdellovibrionales bacterium]
SGCQESQDQGFDFRGIDIETLSKEKAWARAGKRVVQSLPFARSTIGQQVLLPMQLRFGTRVKLDALHFPAHMDAPAWCPLPYAITVLDLIPLVLSDLYKADRPGWRYHLARWFELTGIRNASLVFAISQNTAFDVHNILGIPYDKIVVTPLGVSEKFQSLRPLTSVDQQRVRSELGICSDTQVVLYVGGIDPRKNMLGLIEVHAGLCERAKSEHRTPPVLVLAGDIKRDREYPKLRQLIERFQLAPLVRELGFVSDERLGDLYQCSSCLLFPSLYEGFGLTPLEAMSAGLPVVSSNTSAMPEVIGGAGVLYDPTDVKAGIAAVESILLDHERANELRALGLKQSARFTWEATVEKTIAGYDRLRKMRK